LGRTLEVVEQILGNPPDLDQLYQCYFSDDEVVRLRTSNAIKRICKEHPEWVAPYLDRLLKEITPIDQASTQWTLATLFEWLEGFMSPAQKQQALAQLKHNLATHQDWIVLNTTMDTLGKWAMDDDDLHQWIAPQLTRLRADKRKSVAGKALKISKKLELTT
jgi:hypothetical protein